MDAAAIDRVADLALADHEEIRLLFKAAYRPSNSRIGRA
jgi:hypothetical protein